MSSDSVRNIGKFSGGDDYNTWKFKMQLYLKTLGLLDIIQQPIPADRSKEWNEKNVKALFEITEYLDDSLIQRSNTAKRAFKHLDQTYGRVSEATQTGIKKKLHRLAVKENEAMKQYFARFENLLRELTAAGGKFTENDKVTWLTGELPTAYNVLMDSIKTLSNKKHNINYIKARLLEKEAEL